MKVKPVQKKLQDGITRADSSSSSKVINEYARLPCRGCLVSCKNYHRCGGQVWRMTD